MDKDELGDGNWSGAADVEYITAVQAGGWGETLRSFLRFAGITASDRVLDVGTGPALLPRVLTASGARLAAGCDDSLPMLRRAMFLARDEGRGVPLVAADALRLPFGSGAFDVAIATNLLFLLPRPADGLAAMVRTVRAGGKVAFVNPSEIMSVASASAFVSARGMSGFERRSFVNYGRLAEEHRRLSAAQWETIALDAGLGELRCQTRADGLIVFVSGFRKTG